MSRPLSRDYQDSNGISGYYSSSRQAHNYTGIQVEEADWWTYWRTRAPITTLLASNRILSLCISLAGAHHFESLFFSLPTTTIFNIYPSSRLPSKSNNIPSVFFPPSNFLCHASDEILVPSPTPVLQSSKAKPLPPSSSHSGKTRR